MLTPRARGSNARTIGNKGFAVVGGQILSMSTDGSSIMLNEPFEERKALYCAHGQYPVMYKTRILRNGTTYQGSAP